MAAATLQSWDSFQVPLPFSRVHMQLADPIQIPRDATTADREAKRLAIEQALNHLNPD